MQGDEAAAGNGAAAGRELFSSELYHPGRCDTFGGYCGKYFNKYYETTNNRFGVYTFNPSALLERTQALKVT